MALSRRSALLDPRRDGVALGVGVSTEALLTGRRESVVGVCVDGVLNVDTAASSGVAVADVGVSPVRRPARIVRRKLW